MTNNPSTLALREEVARLRTENETLKSQVGNQSMASESVSGTGESFVWRRQSMSEALPLWPPGI
jgi:hypothetical protein